MKHYEFCVRIPKDTLYSVVNVWEKTCMIEIASDNIIILGSTIINTRTLDVFRVIEKCDEYVRCIIISKKKRSRKNNIFKVGDIILALERNSI
jgi:hypothetical protein